MAPPGVILSVFTDHLGQPMVFYIDPMDPQKEKYRKRIQEAGGLVEDDERALHRGVTFLSTYPHPEMLTVRFAFIEDLLAEGRVRYLNDYQELPRDKKRHVYDGDLDAADAVAQALAKKQKMTKSTTKFTPEADEYILEQVRLKPRFRTLHKFFEELAQHDMLRGHTGNSVRLRYRAHLEHKLQYVYQTDEFDNLMLDANGERIPINVVEAKTIKTRFTADDDYQLCNDIISHVMDSQDPELLKYDKDGNLDENKFSVSISFFDEYARHHPQHLLLSWRDRYRKFARVFGLQKYRDYYLSESKSKDGPQPMKNLTLRALKEKKKIENNVRRIRKVDDALSPLNGHLIGHVPHLPTLMDASTAAAVANMAVSARDLALDEEIGQVKNSNIDDALHHVAAEGRIDMARMGLADHSQIHPSLAGSIDLDFALEEIKVDADSQDHYAKLMVYVPQGAEMDDLFHQGFFSFKQLHKTLHQVRSILERLLLDLIPKVYEEFSLLGFTLQFTGHIFKVTTANANSMITFLERFFKVAQSNLLDALFPRRINGLWIPDYDLYLKNGDYAKLDFMDNEHIQNRRNFLRLSD